MALETLYVAFISFAIPNALLCLIGLTTSATTAAAIATPPSATIAIL
jgi:hypothetical protein